MSLYLNLIAALIVVIGTISALANVAMGRMRTGYRRILRFFNAMVLAVTVVFYACSLFGLVDPGVTGAALMRPIILLYVTLFLCNVIVNWPSERQGNGT